MGIGALQSCEAGYCKVRYAEPDPKSTKSSPAESKVTTVEETTPVAVSANDVESVESTESARGVIRNLLDGHFRGVADVRLRINFAEEIAALEADKAAEQTRTGISNINGMVVSEIESFLGTEGLDEGLSAVISDGIAAFSPVEGAVDPSITVPVSPDSDPIAQLQSTFSAYIDSIRTALVELPQDVPEDVTETPYDSLLDESLTPETEVPATGEGSTVPDWRLVVEQFITDLSLSFEAAVSDLRTELESLTVLPELSQPNGQGRAYDKFLSIYNEMRQTDTDHAEVNAVDTTA
jgi:hypothetical protein